MNWHFEELTHTKTLRAFEPDGTEHLVKMGDMNSLAGIRLLNAMVRDLTKTGTNQLKKEHHGD
jgi:hypothetical protein